MAGVLRDRKGRVLLSQRLAGKHLAGLWEFPGGKIDAGETPVAALKRELIEELGICVTRSRPLLSLTHCYPEKTVRLMLREVSGYRGEPRSLEGQPLMWAAPEELDLLAMPAADRPIVKALEHDPRYAITPDPATVGGIDAVVDWVGRALERGAGLLQLRAHSLDESQLAALARRVGQMARRSGARWLLNATAQAAMDAGADGVHLTARRMLALNLRPLPEKRLVVTSCHGIDELAHAGQIGADFVTLSPVRVSASHPHAQPLGWPGFSRLCAHSPLPVFALGGVGPDDLDKARAHGAFGVSGISAFASP